MTRVLVTGGTGSLGNALVPRLLEDLTIERVIVYSRDEQKQNEMACAFATIGWLSTLETCAIAC